MVERGTRHTNVGVTADGWVVEDEKYFRLLMDHNPPRPRVYRRQLSVDARSWKPVTLWIAGLFLLAFGALAGQWPVALSGVMVFILYLWMYVKTVRHFRNSPIMSGVIDALTPHPIVGNCSTAEAKLADGRTTVVVVATRLAADILKERGRADVVFLYDSKSEYSNVIGVRPMANPPAG
jgi:hypothetical protein